MHAEDGGSASPNRYVSAAVPTWLPNISGSPVEQVPIARIGMDGSAKIRLASSTDHVRLLAEVPGALPPIVVHRQSMKVIDGVHRLLAALSAGRTTIAVRFFDGREEDSLALAAHANISHGLPLTLAERKDAARRLIASHPHWSDRMIGSVTGLTHKTVGAERGRSGGEGAQASGRIGRDGRVHRRDVAAGRAIAAEIIRSRPQASLREIARESGISVGTAKDVRDRMSRSDDAVPRLGRTGEAPSNGPDMSPTPSGELGVESMFVESDTGVPTGGPVSTSIQHHVFRSLRNDPALRFNDKGKTVLRRIAAAVMDLRSWEEITEDVPAHCRVSMTKLARANARAWQELAERLERATAADRVQLEPALGGGRR